MLEVEVVRPPGPIGEDRARAFQSLGYQVIPVRCGDDVFSAFLHIRAVADFHTDLAPNVSGAPLTPKATTRKAA